MKVFRAFRGIKVFKDIRVFKDIARHSYLKNSFTKKHTMYLDIFIGIVLLFALVRGMMNGLIKEIASTIGFLLGLLVAATCYETLGEYLTVDGSEVNMFTSIVAFLLLWIIVPIIFGLIATLITKALNLTALGVINRILGGVLSMAKFVILLSCVLNVMVSLNILNSERTEGSVLLDPVQYITKFAIKHVSENAPELIEKAGELIPEKK